MRRAAGLVAVTTALVALTGCGVTTEHRSINAAVVSGSAGFAPSRITVDKGDKVVLRVGNRATAKHGFSIRGYSVQTTVDPGQTVKVRLTANRVGRFDVYCQLHAGHKHAVLVVK